MKNNKITEQEFLRGKEQIRSSLILGQESTSAQMLLYGKKLLFADKQMDIKDRIKEIDKVTMDDVLCVIDEFYHVDKIATATVGPTRGALKN
jgi:predicted Zn-dependent peptidase